VHQFLARIERLKKLKAQYGAPAPERFTELRAKSLGRFIPALTPDYREPVHLAPLLQALEALFGGRRRLCVSVPPRHAKSDTLLHFIAWLLLRNPKARILYVTHTKSFALRQSKTARRLARACGIRLAEESNRGDEWETEAGGGLTARGIDGDITGRGFDVILVDDPVKSRKVAESSLQREAIFQWFTQDVFTRLTPTGSVMVVHTRWHVDDLIGRLVNDKGYQRLNIRAIAIANDNGEPDNDNWKDPRDDGEALWPDGGWTVEVLDERRRLIGEYGWWSLYQGEPRPRGGAVFEEPAYYDELPSRAYRVSYGIDLAYSKKTYADWSVCIELWREDRDGHDKDGKPLKPLFYVVEVQRKQVKAPEFLLTLHSKQSKRRAPMRWYAYGAELGIADFISQKVKSLEILSTSADHFQRAQPVAACWNDGRLLVPSNAALGLEEDDSQPDWLVCFLDEVTNFVGAGDLHDDQVDALAAAYDVLSASLRIPDQPKGNMSRWGGSGGRGFG
jgi:hypothetical protein